MAELNQESVDHTPTNEVGAILDKGPDLKSVVRVDKVKEIVEKSHEGPTGRVASDDTPMVQQNRWAGISDSVLKLLKPQKKHKKVIIPSQDVQKAKLKKYFKKEIRGLTKKAEKIANTKTFSAEMLESVFLEIRQLQHKLDTLIDLAAEALENLYKQYFVKTA